MPNVQRRFASTAETSKYLASSGIQYSRHTLEQMRSEGTSIFPFYKLTTGRVVYDLDEVDSYIESCRVPDQLNAQAAQL